MPNGRLVDWLDNELAARDKKPTKVALDAGLDRAIMSKWRGGQEAKADDVRRFVATLGAPVIEAFLAAGFLQLKDTQMTEVRRPVTAFGDNELIGEIQQRMKGLRDALAAASQQGTSGQAGQAQKNLNNPQLSGGDRLRDLTDETIKSMGDDGGLDDTDNPHQQR